MRRGRRPIASFIVCSIAWLGVGPTGLAQEAENEILVYEVAFTPSDLHIEPGETVAWRVEENGHTVTSRDDLFDFEVEKGDLKRFTFKREGTFRYFCKLHASMRGVITVGDGCAGRCDPCADCKRLTRRVPSAAYPTIKRALLGAPTGTLIEVRPGRYDIRDTIEMKTPGVTIRGVKRNGRPAPPGAVVLRGRGGAEVGVRILTEASDKRPTTVENLTLTGFLDSGVSIENATGFAIRHLVTRSNGDTGIDIDSSSWGTLDHVTAVGHRNAGISVSACEECALWIIDSESRGNFQGLEAVDAHAVAVEGSRFTANANGISLRSTTIQLSGGPGGIRLFDNVIADNGDPEAPAPSFSEFAKDVFPAGAGVWIHGRAGDIVMKNRISRNHYGVVVTGGPQWSQRHRVLRNLLRDNTVDLGWDGAGEEVCFSGNEHSTSEPNAIQDLYACDRSIQSGIPHPKVRADLVAYAATTYYCRQLGGPPCP